MDECGKFILIVKTLRSSAADPITVIGFSDHNAKYAEVLDNNKRLVNSGAAKIALQLSKGFDLSEVAKLNYQAIANGSILSEAQIVNAEPLRYRNEAFYVDFAEGWKSPRHPSDEVCAAQIKLVKGAAKSYLYFIEEEGLQWLVDHPEYFG